MEEVSEQDIENLKIIRDGVTSIIRESASKYDRSDCIVLDIAPQRWNGAREFYKQSTIETLDIDLNAGATYIADITNNNSNIIRNDMYDVVIFTEVLEHTLNPFDAINEVYRILKPGGVLVMTTPFNFRIHNPLPDCWRISEHGLRHLLKNFSTVEIIENGVERYLFPVQYKTIAIK